MAKELGGNLTDMILSPKITLFQLSDTSLFGEKEESEIVELNVRGFFFCNAVACFKTRLKTILSKKASHFTLLAYNCKGNYV